MMTRRVFLWQGFKLVDVFSMAVCFGLTAMALAFPAPGPPLRRFLSIRVSLQNALLFALLLVAWHVLFAALGLYRSHRLAPLRRELSDVVLAAMLASGLLGLWGGFGGIEFISVRFVGMFFVVSAAVLTLSRTFLRFLLGKFRARGRNLRHLVIAGTNPRAIALGRLVESRPELGYRLHGFTDEEWPGLEEWRRCGFPLVSDLAEFHEYLREHVVDEVIVCLPVKSRYRTCEEIVQLCRKIGVTVRFHSELFGVSNSPPSARLETDEQVFTVYDGENGSWSSVAKRATDIVVSTILLIVLSPLFLAIAILVKLTDPGPAIFAQERLGIGRRRFLMHKFRSMSADAEAHLPALEAINEASGPAFKIKRDPRVTALGRLLRRTSLDELPQLLNVLKGDMSLVGPRPLPLRDYRGFTEDWHRRRFSVRPGITCLWQVSGRSSVSFERWMEMDMYYIDNWSYWMDLEILLRTVPAVLRGAGAV